MKPIIYFLRYFPSARLTRRILLAAALVLIALQLYNIRLAKKINQNFAKPNVPHDSALAHKYLDGLHGVEIGGSSYNPFNIRGMMNVDFTDNQTIWVKTSGTFGVAPLPVNIVASGDDLPFKSETLDFVLTSHVIEHFFDPIKALKEWHRVIKRGGYIFLIVPHKDRTFDSLRDVTSVDELMRRHDGRLAKAAVIAVQNKLIPAMKQAKYTCTFDKIEEDKDGCHHWSVWRTKDFLDLCAALGFNVVESHDTDDKVGNGFTVVIRK